MMSTLATRRGARMRRFLESLPASTPLALLHRWRERSARRRAEEALAALPPHLLADIGALNPSDEPVPEPDRAAPLPWALDRSPGARPGLPAAAAPALLATAWVTRLAPAERPPSGEGGTGADGRPG